MSERPVSFFPVPVACNDAFDPAERAVRAVNGLTLRAAFEALSDAEIVLCAGRAPSDGAAGTERVWRALNGLATGEALEALRRAREIVLDGHRIDVFADRMTLALESARMRRTLLSRGVS